MEDFFSNILIGLIVVCLLTLIYLFVYAAIQFGIASILFVLLTSIIFIAITALIGAIANKVFDIFD
ncbi:hypothetical protein A8C46_00105 [Ligilactobacillus salivarius]|nr:hypothetical protein A8C38_00535 [Ligilactobacillus salivarius]PAY43631.1 hypothetical protein A8C39_00715 [Ligilactobacillus salivarius]PAY49445.1 hypothetical protein A8C42_00860 [Ligilactobacillus salivarius]PAY58009.1 hypothetical protein A8C46_00105 [Ligilactobacillus salivarius]PAY61899.1 hypothetical protein A8C47_01405 [Ligilactobacillus salivarius]